MLGAAPPTVRRPRRGSSPQVGFDEAADLLRLLLRASPLKNCQPASGADAARMPGHNGCRLSPPDRRGQDGCVSPHSPAGRLPWSFAGLPRQVCGR
jgi:hypothetical protein